MNSNDIVKISFLGDISLNNKYIDLYKTGVNPFEKISQNITNSDLVIGNLECLATGKDGENELKVPRLGTNVETLNYLTDININIVTLAHNHIYDHLESGYVITKEFLKSNHIDSIGAGISINEASKPIYKEINRLKFCFLNYVTKDTNPNLPNNVSIKLNYFDIETAVSDVKEVRSKVDFVIILLHWGGLTENGYYPDLNQPIYAKRLIDIGADLIIGHHSHTMQPFEKYKGKYIFYSLGNFCFDDVVYKGKMYYKLGNRQKKSIIVNASFFNNDYKIDLLPIYNNELIIEPKKRLIYIYKFRNFVFSIIKAFPFLWKFYFYQFKKTNRIYRYFFVKEGSFWGKLSSILIKKGTKLFANNYSKY